MDTFNDLINLNQYTMYYSSNKDKHLYMLSTSRFF